MKLASLRVVMLVACICGCGYLYAAIMVYDTFTTDASSRWLDTTNTLGWHYAYDAEFQEMVFNSADDYTASVHCWDLLIILALQDSKRFTCQQADENNNFFLTIRMLDDTSNNEN